MPSLHPLLSLSLLTSPLLSSPSFPSSSFPRSRRWYGNNARSEASNNGSTKSACSDMPRVVQLGPMVLLPFPSIELNIVRYLRSKRALCSNSLVLNRGRYHCAGPATCSDGGDTCQFRRDSVGLRVAEGVVRTTTTTTVAGTTTVVPPAVLTSEVEKEMGPRDSDIQWLAACIIDAKTCEYEAETSNLNGYETPSLHSHKQQPLVPGGEARTRPP